MKNIGFQKWKTISIYAVCVIIMSVVYAAYYRNVRQQALSDAGAYIMKCLQKEMDARVDSVSKDIQVWGKGSLLGNESGITVFYSENGKEKFEINAASDSLNISHISFERIAHSFSLLESPFQVDSFRRICENGLKEKNIYVHLFFNFRDRKTHFTSGDSLSTYPLINCNIGNGNEYTLKAYVYTPFLFSWNVGIGLGIVVLIIAIGGVYGYRRKHKSEPEATQEALHEEMSVATNKVCYVREYRTFYLPNSEHTVQLTKREAEIFEALYFAPEHTMLSADLKQKIIGDTTIQTSALSTRLGEIRKKLKKVGDFNLEYSRTTYCYVLSVPLGDIEIINMRNLE